MTASLILINGISGSTFCKLNVDQITENENLPKWLLNMKAIDIIHGVTAFASLINCLQGIYLAYTHTEQRPRISVVIGLVPMILWFMIFVCIWGFTDWGWTNTGYATILIFPVFSLMSSRQIVCNFTKQYLDPIPKSCFWFLLFPLNKYIVSFLRKFSALFSSFLINHYFCHFIANLARHST